MSAEMIVGTKKKLEALCSDLGIAFTAHDSHGFYLDVLVAGRCITLDPTPDNVWRDGKLVKEFPVGTLMVRDDSHHYNSPTHIAAFDLNEDGALDKLLAFLIDGVAGARPVDSITGEEKERGEG